jgi:hypothetical protein
MTPGDWLLTALILAPVAALAVFLWSALSAGSHDDDDAIEHFREPPR